jgi:molybdenum-dependent DNA-binding transcriptional regulator ModE
MSKVTPDLTPTLRLLRPDGLRFGPRKAQLFAHIDATGLITAAGLTTGIKHKRDVDLFAEMKALFLIP